MYKPFIAFLAVGVVIFSPLTAFAASITAFPSEGSDTVDYYHTDALVRAEADVCTGHPSDDAQCDGGFRFVAVSVPQGATIESAVIKWTASTNRTTTVPITIQAQKAANPSTFALTVSDFTSRTLTTASVSYTPPTTTTASTTYTTTDLTSIVQELVNQGTWSSGNSMVFFFFDNGAASSNVITTAGYADGRNLPELDITYASSGGSGVVPAQEIFASSTLQESNIATYSIVDNPVADLFFGFIIFFISCGGTIWFFRKAKK